MKKFSQSFLFFVAFSFVLSVISVTAQKDKQSPDDIPSTPEKVEVKNDPPPVSEPTKSEPTSSPSYSSSSDTDDIPTQRTNRTERTTIRNERRQRTRRARQRADIERRRREAAEAARRNRDKDDDKYEDCPTYDTYGDCYNYTDEDDGSSSSVSPSWGSFYNENDLYFTNYSFFVDGVTENFAPYFLTTLPANYKPLHRVAVFEQLADVKFIEDIWAFYYEPDLDFMHINFEQISQKSKFEKIVINAVGKKTIKRAGKRFKEKRTTRPVVVEDISIVPLDRIYVLNLNRLPKGTYEMKLLSQSGDTIKLPFTIK